MAYMSQERKKAIEPAVKAALKKYGLKGSLSVEHHSGLALTIREGAVDFMNERVTRTTGGFDPVGGETYLSVNKHYYQEQHSGQSLAFLSEVIPAMMEGNHDNSDAMTDYFDVGWYVYVYVGKWNKPYVYKPATNALADAMVPKGWDVAETSTEETAA